MDQQQPKLEVDANGFLRANGEKAPFKYDPSRQVIEFLRKDRRGDKPVEVPLAALARIASG